jgi:hypothetical protein
MYRLVMSFMAIVSEGGEDGGSEGVQNNDVLSAPTDRMPLRFLYAVGADDILQRVCASTAR